MKIYDLKCEYMINPIGIDIEKPCFSWKIESEDKCVVQTAYRLIIDGLYDSGRVESEQSLYVPMEGILTPETRYNFSVTVWDNKGNSDSEAGFFETGISKWSATWLEPQGDQSVYKLSKTFSSDCGKARIYATAYGLYEIYLNGERVSDRYLTPGFTSYLKRVQYQTYEVELKAGNTLEVILAKGWCAGSYPFQDKRSYRDNASFLCEVHLDGKCITKTDSSWKCTDSKLRFSEIYDGEIYDAGFDEGKEYELDMPDYGYENIVAQQNTPVRVIDKVKPIKMFTTPKGEKVIDFGQNMVGWVKFRVRGSKGDRAMIKHAEVLDNDGNFYTDNLCSAKQTIEYIMGTGGTEEYHCRLSFQGFRYIQLCEFPGNPSIEDFEGQVICSDMEQTGTFECSDKLINKLFSNIIWGQRGNFVDIPTDCPQRSERAGWTGDAQVFCSTAVINMDTALFYRKWLRDMAIDQDDKGLVQMIIPAINEKDTSSGWGDAATICPWEIYKAYGDKRILSEQYPTMRKWVDYIKNTGNDPYLWNSGHHFGDWLALDAKEGDHVGATATDLIATAYYAYSTLIVAKTAEILGYDDDKKKYSDLYKKVKEAFKKEFITPNGRLASQTQTAYVLALAFDLTDNKRKAADFLADMIHGNKDRLTTGFIGTPYLCNTLEENGYADLAYTLLLQQEYPSWLYSVNKGATTIWEHWDGIKPDGSFWSKYLNSFNHYAYGSIADFMYKKCAGIRSLEPGYKKILIKPVTDDRLTYASASIETPYGKVKSQWQKKDGKLNVVIPPNTTAEIHLPNGEIQKVGSGEYSFRS